MIIIFIITLIIIIIVLVIIMIITIIIIIIALAIIMIIIILILFGKSAYFVKSTVPTLANDQKFVPVVCFYLLFSCTCCFFVPVVFS